MKLLEKPVRSLDKRLPTMSDRVEYLRCVFGYPVSAFTTKVGAGPGALKKVLEGKADPTMILLNNILKMFPVREEWLFLGTGEPFNVDDISSYQYGGRFGADGVDEEINERFKEIRLEKGMSQPLFAAELGITKDVLAFIEIKRTNVSVALVKRLAKKFGISEIWLLYGIGNKYKIKRS